MNENLFSEKFAWFKENEKPEVVLLVADDPKKIRVVVAWSNMLVQQKVNPTLLNGDSESEIWDWLWEQIEYSLDELLEKTALQEYEVKKIFAHLVGNRVIYPDGTVNSFVQRFLREKVVNLFALKTKTSTRTRKSA